MPLMLCVIYYFGNDSSIISLLLCLLFNTFLFDVYILGYNSKDMISLYNGDKEIKIELHKPHPGNVLKPYQINILINKLKEIGVI